MSSLHLPTSVEIPNGSGAGNCTKKKDEKTRHGQIFDRAKKYESAGVEQVCA